MILSMPHCSSAVAEIQTEDQLGEEDGQGIFTGVLNVIPLQLNQKILKGKTDITNRADIAIFIHKLITSVSPRS